MCSPLTYNITLLVYSVWYDTAVVLYDHCTTVLYVHNDLYNCSHQCNYLSWYCIHSTKMKGIFIYYLYTVIVIILQDRRVNGTQFNDWVHNWISGVIKKELKFGWINVVYTSIWMWPWCSEWTVNYSSIFSNNTFNAIDFANKLAIQLFFIWISYPFQYHFSLLAFFFLLIRLHNYLNDKW